MDLTRFIPAPGGGSQFVTLTIPLDNAHTDAFGHTSRRSRVIPAQSALLSEMPAGPEQDWHPASRRQFVVVLSGRVEVEDSSGERRQFGPGQMFLADDSASSGHRTRTLGGPARVLFVHLPRELDLDD